jgi:hypothetical protein
MTKQASTFQRLHSPQLIPTPREIGLTGGALRVDDDKLIVISQPQILFEAQEAQRALSEFAHVVWHINAASDSVPSNRIGISIDVVPQTFLKEKDRQAYILNIGADGIRIRAISNTGAFYGVMTLVQLLRQYGNTLPHLHIEDYPDFPVRGLMFDISRNKVPTMKTLFDLVDKLALLKLNQFQLYMKHTFAYQRHPIVWQGASPMTGEEILQLDAYCRARHIDLVPYQTCFGHMEPWLKHAQYAPLRECPDGFSTRLANYPYGITLHPGNPQSLRLAEEMFDELLPHFTSTFFNIGADETFDLGQGRSAPDAAARGVGRVYLDHLLKLHKLVQQHGRTMQFWGDIIMVHPELVPELPKDSIALEWGYEFDHPFDEHGAMFAASGIPFYVCPGVASWNSFTGRTQNMLGNLHNAAQTGLKHGARGYLLTDWGDRGHLQPLPVSYLGYAYGAGLAWCAHVTDESQLAQTTSLHLFDDASGAFGRLAYQAGQIYLEAPERIHNGSVPAYGALCDEEHALLFLGKTGQNTTAATLKKLHKAVDRIEAQAKKLKPRTAEQVLIKREYLLALQLNRHGLNRIARLTGQQRPNQTKAYKTQWRKLQAEHKKLWLARNRTGGLADSLGNLRY